MIRQMVVADISKHDRVIPTELNEKVGAIAAGDGEISDAVDVRKGRQVNLVPAEFEVGNNVAIAARLEHEDIAASAAGQRVKTLATIKDVISGQSRQFIVAAVADQAIVEAASIYVEIKDAHQFDIFNPLVTLQRERQGGLYRVVTAMTAFDDDIV